MKRRTGWWLAALLLGTTPACQHSSAIPSESAAAASATAVPVAASSLGPGDVFEVRVFQEPDLSGVYRLASDGSINFPLCGRLVLSGLSSAEASDRLSRCLAAGYLKQPQVSIYVKEYNSKKIFVFGEVQKPGTFAYEDGMNVIQAITLAGGFAQRAARNSTSVTRSARGDETRIKVPVDDIGMGRAKNFQLQPGDIVFVPESLF